MQPEMPLQMCLSMTNTKKAIREEILFDVKFDYRDSDTISVLTWE